MILVDTSIWVDHLRLSDRAMMASLDRGTVLMHPFVVGEIALGSLRQRRVILDLLQSLPAAVVATSDEVLDLIERTALAGTGIGYVDAHLLASVRLTRDARIATRDRRLQAVADRLGLLAGLG